MVFAYKPGRPSKAPEISRPANWTHDDHDPFPPVDALRRQPVNERVSWLEETARFVQQWLSELAAGEQALERLRRKLQDPKLSEHPARRKHVHRAVEMEDDHIQLMRDIAWTEAEADRTWKSLTPEERAPVSGHWMTEPETDSLIGAAWFRLSTFEEWPRGFRLNSLHFNDLPEPIIRGMHDVALWAWKPNPDPPDP